MSRQNTTVADVVNDFLLTLSEDDYVSNVADYHVHNLALRGIREMGFDVTKRVKSLSLPISDLGTVDMPDDFVGMLRCGVSGSDGTFYTFKENKNMDMAQEYKLASNGQPIDSDNDGVYDRQALSSTSTMPMQGDNLSNAVNAAGIGKSYGRGGGGYLGHYRINYDQNRLEVTADTTATHVSIEYIADEARSNNPCIHLFAEEALRNYIYYKLVSRKSNVPSNEKQFARNNYYNELRLAKIRMNAFSKEEALGVIRKNFRQSPKF